MSLLNGPVELHLSSMEIIHSNLMGIQHVPNRAEGESGLLEPLAQLLKSLGLRRTVHMTMCTHGINLKEDKISPLEGRTNQTPLPEREGWENDSKDVPNCPNQLERRRKREKTLCW